MDGRRFRVLLAIDVATKAATIVLLLVALSLPELPQFQGKAFAGRAIAYPIALAIVPVVWLLLRRPIPYPVVPDILIGLPFLIDMVGNALGLYDSVEWWTTRTTSSTGGCTRRRSRSCSPARICREVPAPGSGSHGRRPRRSCGSGRVRDVRPRLGGSVNGVRGHARRPRPGAPGRHDRERADRVAPAGRNG